MAAIEIEDFVLFCERTMRFMDDALVRLDDQLVNARPRLDGANSPFALVIHALGAFEWWVGHLVCGAPSTRDRASEFAAVGTVAEARAALDSSAQRLRGRVEAIASAESLHGPARTQTPLDGEWTVGAALIHAYEELAQHLGHLQLTVDLLVADAT